MDKNQDNEFDDDFSNDEFDEIYGEDDLELTSEDPDISESMHDDHAEGGSDLDFIEDDIEEVYPEEHAVEEPYAAEDMSSPISEPKKEIIFYNNINSCCCLASWWCRSLFCGLNSYGLFFCPTC